MQIVSGDIPEVVTDGSGFTIISNTADAGASAITSYNSDGQQIGQISGSYTPACGAADVLVPGEGRLIITELITSKPAAGIEAGKSFVQLDAHRAVNGIPLWSSKKLPLASDANSCQQQTALGYSNNGPDLVNFGTTSNGRWGIYANGANAPRVIDLATGAARADPAAQGTLGTYVVNACLPNNVAGTLVNNIIVDAATGDNYGTFTTGADAYHAQGFCSNAKAGSGLQNLSFSNANNLEFAPAGMFQTNSAGTSPGTGLTANGTGLFVDDTPGANTNQAGIIRYTLPDLRPVWSKNGWLYMWGDSGGILVVTPSDGASNNPSLIGLDDTNGTEQWHISNAQGTVCGITPSQILYATNNQLAILNIKTGKQVSYSANPNSGNQCPAILPGGISWNVRGGTVTVQQIISP